MNSNHFPQAAAGITQSSSKEITTCSLWRRGQGTSPTLHSRAVVGALLSAAVPSPEVFLPGPFVTIPSSGPAVGSALAAYPRWLVAEFEQEVLYERGVAQVGFGVLPLLSLYFLLSKRLTVCLTWFDLVRATAAHRTPSGLISTLSAPYPGFGNPGLKSATPLGLTSLVVQSLTGRRPDEFYLPGARFRSEHGRFQRVPGTLAFGKTGRSHGGARWSDQRIGIDGNLEMVLR